MGIIGARGIRGSYSHYAATRWLDKNNRQRWQIKEYSHFKHLINDLSLGKIDKAALPVENSTTGLITRTMDLVSPAKMYAIAEDYVDLSHSLFVTPGASLEAIRKIYSHPEAITQCRLWLDQHPHIETIPYADTAGSARQVSLQNDPTVAAISSKIAGEMYDLELLQADIQDSSLNTTRFLIFSKEFKANSMANKTSLFIKTPHQTGALYQALGVFESQGLNLDHLTSRPVIDEPFTYGFFIEVAAGIQTSSMQKVLKELEAFTTEIQIIGSYISAR